MGLICWDNKYSVGVQALDSQHTVLFDILNELHTAMSNGQAQTHTGPLLRKLADYTSEHFSAEEALLTATEYPKLNEHHAKHLDLVKQIKDYTTRLERGEISINIHLIGFLRDWLTNHILKTDREYGPWLNEHGVH